MSTALPVIAIIGRPNVGKSTLFNCLTKSREALVADMPGVTRDRKYGEGKFDDNRYIVIDTGGLEADVASDMQQLMSQQTALAMQEADVILFVVDGKQGLIPNDYQIANQLRQVAKPVYLVVNKTEGLDEEYAKIDFYQLGFEHVHAIASAHGRGIKSLMGEVLLNFSAEAAEEEYDPSMIKVAIVGRPNVGKSTLTNRILGEERVLVYDQPGTTRDSISIPFTRHEQSYLLIDTAGVRRKARVTEGIEKFSVIKTLQSIEASQVVIFLLNAREGISDQDLKLIDFVIDAGKALVLAVNKWDNISIEERQVIKKELARRLGFVNFARLHFISALHGTGVGELFKSILEAYRCAMSKTPTSILTRLLQEAVTQHQPPLVHGHRIKLRYAHTGGQSPPLIIIHGNKTEALPLAYMRYLNHFFRKRLKLIGTPLRIEVKSGENPFKDKKNVLTSRQQKKKQRLMKYINKK